MKKLLSLLLVLIAVAAAAQTPTPVVRNNGAVTAVDVRLHTKSLKIPVYTDTARALVAAGIDSIGLIFKEILTSKVWVRDSNLVAGGHIWTQLGTGSGGSLANPTGSIGLTPVNGSSTSGMRADASPGLAVQPAGTVIGNKTGSPAVPTYLTSSDLATLANAITNFSGVNFLGYGLYASKPTTGTGIYFATDSIATGGFFYINGSTVTNLTPSVSLKVLRLGQPGDSTMFSISGSLQTGYIFNVAAQRDSVGSCIHHAINPDGSWSWYSTCVANNGGVSGAKAGTFATRPAASAAPQTFYWSTDSLWLSYSNGTTWTDNKAGSGTGGGASFPAGGVYGQSLVASSSSTQVWMDPRILDTVWLFASGQSQINGGAENGLAAGADTAGDNRVQVWDHLTTYPGAWKRATTNSNPFWTSANGGGAAAGSPNALFYYARKLARTTGKTVRIAWFAVGSSSITLWWNGTSKASFTDSITTMLTNAGFPRVDEFFWDQGESDPSMVASTYNANWDSIHNYLTRQVWFSTTTPWVVTGMPQLAEGAAPGYQGQDGNLQTYDYTRGRWVGYANTDSCQVNIPGNNVHFNLQGYRSIGEEKWWQARRALPMRNFEYLNGGVPVGSTMSTADLDVIVNHPAGTGAKIYGVSIRDTSATGTGGLRIMNKDTTDVLDISVPDKGVTFFHLNSPAIGTRTNNSIDYYQNLAVHFTLSSVNDSFYKSIVYAPVGGSAFKFYNSSSAGNVSATFIGPGGSDFGNFYMANSGASQPGMNFFYHLGGFIWSNDNGTIIGKSNLQAFPTGPRALIDLNGSMALKVDSFSATATMSVNTSNQNWFKTGSTNDTCFVPSSTNHYGLTFWVMKTDAGSGYVRIYGSGGTIGINGTAGASVQLLNQYDAASVTGDGNGGWYVKSFPASVGSSPPFADNTAIAKNNSDNTKLAKLDLSGITTATTRTYSLPDYNGIFAMTNHIQTFSQAQSYTAPVYVGGTYSASNSALFTLDGNSAGTSAPSVRGFWLNMTRGNTWTEGSSGTIGSGAGAYFGDNTFAAGSATTYTNAATVMINNAPTAGTNVTMTNSWALYVAAGNSLFNGNISGNNGSMSTFTHLLGNNNSTNAPSIAAGAGAGTSPTVSRAGTDMDGSITVTTGTLPTGSNATIATLTYGYAYPANSYVTLTPGNALTAALSGVSMVYITPSTSNFLLVSGTTALTASSTYVWYYHVGGY